MPIFETKKRFFFAIFGLDVENNIVIFEISTLTFVYLQTFAKKQKCSNLGAKMPVWCIFGLKLQNVLVNLQWSLKRILAYLKSIPLSSKVGTKTKMPKLLTKHALLGIFAKKMSFLGNLALELYKKLLQRFVKKEK